MSDFTLTKLINEIGDENAEVQVLSATFTKAKERRGLNEVSFVTDQTFNMDGPEKECLMVWVEKDVFNAAVEKLKESKSE